MIDKWQEKWLAALEEWIRRIVAEDDSVESAMNTIHARDAFKKLIEKFDND